MPVCYLDSANTGQHTERGDSRKCCGDYYMGLSYGNDVVGQPLGPWEGARTGVGRWAALADRILPSWFLDMYFPPNQTLVSVRGVVIAGAVIVARNPK